MLQEPMIAAIRTGVAALVGFVVAFLVAKGFSLDQSFALNMTAVLTVLFTGAYNYLVIYLEKHVSPVFGYLLGIPKTPSYK
jgi:hypothetical protein